MKNFIQSHRVTLAAVLLLVLAFVVYSLASDASKMDMSMGEHMKHLKAAQDQLKKPTIVPPKFNVSLGKPDMITPGASTTIDFTVYDAKTGDQVTKFDIISDKLMHLIVVNDALTYFDHIHPVFDGKKFSVTHKFPKADSYRLYTDFQPRGAEETQVGFKVIAGAPTASAKPFDRSPFDSSLSRKFGAYNVALSGSFKATDIVSGASPFVFTITDAKTGKPVTDLRTYLGAFGHMVMINTDTLSYIHVHPMTTDLSTGMAGPEVRFQPMGLGGTTVYPGTYRVFAQFQPTSGLFTSDFIIDIK
ncbi:MAG TPA: hypothetical protein VGE35_01420 [Candidatus Paceibacterota bacterium]